MCLAIPMEVVSVGASGKARVRREGLEIEADLSLVEGVRPGDYLIVHAGFAIEKLDLREAEERLELFRQVAEAGGDGCRDSERGGGGASGPAGGDGHAG